MGELICQKCPNFDLGISKPQWRGGSFSEMSELKVGLTSSKIRRIKPTFLVFSHANMPFFMSA